MIDLTDAELVGQALAGADAPYAQLVARHRSRLMRYAARLLGNREDAEEVVQDSFVRAYRSLTQCEQPERFGAWLFTILVNRSRSAAARRNGARVRFVSDDGVEGPGVPHPEDGAAWREEIQRALAVLPVDQREAFLLKHVEELSYEEMERATGATTPALKMRVKRACDRLREELTDVLRQ